MPPCGTLSCAAKGHEIHVTFAKVLFGLLGLAAVVYALVLVWFRANENALLFHPEVGKLAEPPAALVLDSQDVEVISDDGTVLVGRLIPPPKTPNAAWILYFHGASGNVGTLGYNQAWAKFRRLGLGVFAIDYRGYGQSAGVPSEAGFYRDALAAHAYLTKRLQVPPSRIVLYGYSLGSAVAIDLATRAPAAGLIVEGALLSVPIRAAELYPFLPVHTLARNRFASVDKIASVAIPKLLIHARADSYVPIGHGQRLFDLATEPKRFFPVAGDHTTAHEVDPAFFATIARFVAELGLETSVR